MSMAEETASAAPRFVAEAREMSERIPAGGGWVSEIAQIIASSSDEDLGTMAAGFAVLSSLRPSEIPMQEAVAANEDRSAEHPAARVPAPRADPVLASTRVSRDEARVRARILAARAGAIEGGAIGILAFSSIRGALLPIVLLVGVGMLSASIATTRVRSLSPAGRPYRVGDLVAKSLFVSTIALMVGMAFFCGIRGLV